MTQLSSNWAEILEPGLKAVFYKRFAALQESSRIPMLFNMDPSTKSAEHFLGVGALSDFEEFTGTIEYEDFNKGFGTTITHKTYVKGHAIEQELAEDEMYNVMGQRSRALAMAASSTRENHAASVFNNAFSASFVGGDAVSLCNASHPHSPSNASVQSNAGSTALSYDATVATRTLMRAFTDDKGNKIPMNPNLILIPEDLEATANEIVETFRGSNTQQPGTGSYDANLVQEKRIDYLVWPELTDVNNWFLLDSVLAEDFLMWLDRVLISYELDPTSAYDMVARFRGRMRYSYGWIDWPWLYGHNVE